MENLWYTEKYDPFAKQQYTIRHLVCILTGKN